MGDSQTVPIDRVRVFNIRGEALAEFKATVDRSYAIGDEARAQFTYPTRKTDVVNDDVLRWGNWLMVENSVLPTWIGVIDQPREWSTRSVTVSAYGPEHVLGWRIASNSEEVLTGPAGRIFAHLITRANRPEQTVIRVGNIWKGGEKHQVTINPSPISEYLKKLWEDSGDDYAWAPAITGEGRLIIRAHWLKRLGVDTTILLHEGNGGGNIEAAGRIMTEDGPIVNEVYAYGEGQTWQSKPAVKVKKPASIGRYGLRQLGQEYSGVTSDSALIANAKQKLKEFAKPTRTFALNALNVGDTFKYLRLGNVLTVQFQNAGFTGGQIAYESQVRIIGMRYNPATKNKIELVTREVPS